MICETPIIFLEPTIKLFTGMLDQQSYARKTQVLIFDVFSKKKALRLFKKTKINSDLDK